MELLLGHIDLRLANSVSDSSPETSHLAGVPGVGTAAAAARRVAQLRGAQRRLAAGQAWRGRADARQRRPARCSGYAVGSRIARRRKLANCGSERHANVERGGSGRQPRRAEAEAAPPAEALGPRVLGRQSAPGRELAVPCRSARDEYGCVSRTGVGMSELSPLGRQRDEWSDIDSSLTPRQMHLVGKGGKSPKSGRDKGWSLARVAVGATVARRQQKGISPRAYVPQAAAARQGKMGLPKRGVGGAGAGVPLQIALNADGRIGELPSPPDDARCVSTCWLVLRDGAI